MAHTAHRIGYHILQFGQLRSVRRVVLGCLIELNAASDGQMFLALPLRELNLDNPRSAAS